MRYETNPLIYRDFDNPQACLNENSWKQSHSRYMTQKSSLIQNLLHLMMQSNHLVYHPASLPCYRYHL
ncbi:hypothetical protein HanPI659440_Chr09g0327101 [Helianthus annuus]|nr:hypothetical protein HanPI659440_Chr09g0327101 [Helianthus annuus]